MAPAPRNGIRPLTTLGPGRSSSGIYKNLKRACNVLRGRSGTNSNRRKWCDTIKRRTSEPIGLWSNTAGGSGFRVSGFRVGYWDGTVEWWKNGKTALLTFFAVFEFSRIVRVTRYG